MALVSPGVSVKEVDVTYVVNPMAWKCPEHWKYKPEMEQASEGMLMGLLFGGKKRWNQVRNPWFRRCNASGNWIWPMQKAWVGIVSLDVNPDPWSDTGRTGTYAIAWLSEEHFIIEQLKGNI